MQSLWISKDSCIIEENEKLIKRKAAVVSVPPGFEGYKCRERQRPGESFSYLKLWGHDCIGEYRGPALFHFNRERMDLESQATRKVGFGWN